MTCGVSLWVTVSRTTDDVGDYTNLCIRIIRLAVEMRLHGQAR